MALINKTIVKGTTYDIQDRLIPDNIGLAGQILKVNSSRTGLEFANESGGSDITVVQTTGQSTANVMSQKAVTDELNEISATIGEAVVFSSTTYPPTAVNGNITSEQLAKLQANAKNYISWNNEIYTLNDNQHLSGALGYTHNGYESNTPWQKTIVITINSLSWVLKISANVTILSTDTTKTISAVEQNALLNDDKATVTYVNGQNRYVYHKYKQTGTVAPSAVMFFRCEDKTLTENVITITGTSSGASYDFSNTPDSPAAVIALSSASGTITLQEFETLKGNHAIIEYSFSGGTNIDETIILTKNEYLLDSNGAFINLTYSNIKSTSVGGASSRKYFVFQITSVTSTNASYSISELEICPRIVKLTQTQYDALTTKNAETVYFIVN